MITSSSHDSFVSVFPVQESLFFRVILLLIFHRRLIEIVCDFFSYSCDYHFVTLIFETNIKPSVNFHSLHVNWICATFLTVMIEWTTKQPNNAIFFFILSTKIYLYFSKRVSNLQQHSSCICGNFIVTFSQDFVTKQPTVCVSLSWDPRGRSQRTCQEE